MYKRAYAASIVGTLRSAFPEGTGEVATGERQRWPPVRSTRAGHIAVGMLVQYNRSFHMWRSSAVMSSSIKVSRSLCNFVFRPLFLLLLSSNIDSNFRRVARMPHQESYVRARCPASIFISFR